MSKADLGLGGSGIESNMNGFGISPRVGATYQIADAVALVFNLNDNILFGQNLKIEGEDFGSVEYATNFVGIGLGARFNIGD